MLAKKRFLSPSSPRKWKEKRFACNSVFHWLVPSPEPLPDTLNLLLHASLDRSWLTGCRDWIRFSSTTGWRYWFTLETTKQSCKRCSDFAYEFLNLWVFDNSLQLVLLVASIYCSVSGCFFTFLCFIVLHYIRSHVFVCFLYCCV